MMVRLQRCINQCNKLQKRLGEDEQSYLKLMKPLVKELAADIRQIY